MLSQQESQRYFLDVERSVSGRVWRSRLPDNRQALAISERYDLPELLGRVLAGRSVGLEGIGQYLKPTLRESMPQVMALRDIEKGARRLADAVTKSRAHRHHRRLRCRRLDIGGLVDALPARGGQRCRNSYSGSPWRRLWPEPHSGRGAGRQGREAAGDRGLRCDGPRSTFAGRRTRLSIR